MMSSTLAMAQEIDEVVVTGMLRNQGNTMSSSSVGFDKSLMETPRAVSFVSTEQIELFNVSSINDLARLVPGVFTTQRRGYEGAINVRGVPANSYYRGMRRLNFQGHTRTILGAMDTIEVVKGPPSPIFGMGMIGGYANMNPKAGRAGDGKYLNQSEGFSQLTFGSFDKSEVQLGLGGPTTIGGKDAGYYVFAMQEDSGGYTDRVDVGQKYLQASVSVDNFVGPFRLDVGTQYQRAQNKGVILTRITQGTVDDGTYVRGVPLARLDLNGDGRIGYLEQHLASPVAGNVSASNQPLSQRFSWPRDANGNYYELGSFPAVSGIPQSLMTYLAANPAADPTGAMRAQGVGGPRPQSGFLPIGFALDPTTTGYSTVDYRANPTLERDQDAKVLLAYVDLVYDEDPDFTVKNQMFFDGMDQYKIGDQPFSEEQKIWAFENKFTVVKRVSDDFLPDWLAVNSLGSLNYRYNYMDRRTAGGDFDYRNDATVRLGEYTANTTFWTPAENASYETGQPYTTMNSTRFNEVGLGLMFDMDIFEKAHLMVGGRYDYSRARNTDFAAFTFATGTSANPGQYQPADRSAKGSDAGASYTASLSYDLPYGLRPYATVARSSLSLVGSSQQLGNATINAGTIGQGELKEVGIKGSWLNDRLFISTAFYEQSRNDVNEPDDPSFGAEVTSQINKGIEVEVKWSPSKNLFFTGYVTRQRAEYLDLPVGANINIDARTLGFQDVVDPATGEVLYPAEAFTYGGRAFLVMPAALASRYGDLTGVGTPEWQANLSAGYTMDNGIGFSLNASYFDEAYTSRLKNVTLPSVVLVNAGINYAIDDQWFFQLTVNNLTNETWFRGRSGYTSPDVMNPQPDRHWLGVVRYNF